jgi:hypothetical protein
LLRRISLRRISFGRLPLEGLVAVRLLGRRVWRILVG